MISVYWNPASLAIAGLIALLADFWLAWLLHLRYRRQFGAGFVAAGVVVFSLPALLFVAVPAYLLLESGLSLPERLLLLGVMGLCGLWAGWRMGVRLLSRRFSAEDVRITQEQARMRAEQEHEEAKAAAEETEPGL